MGEGLEARLTRVETRLVKFAQANALNNQQVETLLAEVLVKLDAIDNLLQAEVDDAKDKNPEGG